MKSNESLNKTKDNKKLASYDFVRFKPVPVCKDVNGNLVLSISLPEK